MERKTLLELIRKIILNETLYMRHYEGKVFDVNDPDKIGRVKVLVSSLAWDTDSRAPWCSPRQNERLTTPKKGQSVEIYFLEADRDKPVYSGLATEMENSIPTLHKGKPENQVLFEDPITNEGILYDQLAKIFKIAKGNEVIVLGNALQSFLSTFVTTFNAHTHAGITPGPGVTATPLPTQTSPSGLLSTKIKVE